MRCPYAPRNNQEGETDDHSHESRGLMANVLDQEQVIRDNWELKERII